MRLDFPVQFYVLGGLRACSNSDVETIEAVSTECDVYLVCEIG